VTVLAQSVGDFFGEPSVDGWDLAVAAIVLVVTVVVARLVRRSVLRASGRLVGMSQDSRGSIARLASYLVYVLGFAVALGVLGAATNPVLVVVLVIGIVVVLALRGVAESFAAGVVIRSSHALAVGDEIESLGCWGTVREMNARSVVIETIDGRTAFLPNARLLDSPMLNNTTRAARRSEVEVRVPWTDGSAAVVELVRSEAARCDGVLAEPPVAVALRSVERGRATLVVSVFHAPAAGDQVVGAVIDAVHRSLLGRNVAASVNARPLGASVLMWQPLWIGRNGQSGVRAGRRCPMRLA
jgi:small-conductance mechanosensitive channel